MEKQTIGKTNVNDVTLHQLFVQQMINQDALLHKGVYDRFKEETTITVPVDDIGLASYHVQQLMSEIGEVLDADKRWKSHRNEKYNKVEKLEELADCFIVLMNIALFSGFDGRELTETIVNKLSIISNRIGDI
jgi:NTP pyrophosphatase (non-canonical NTP hydrolase)